MYSVGPWRREIRWQFFPFNDILGTGTDSVGPALTNQSSCRLGQMGDHSLLIFTIFPALDLSILPIQSISDPPKRGMDVGDKFPTLSVL
jgi:hypothetical protein